MQVLPNEPRQARLLESAAVERDEPVLRIERSSSYEAQQAGRGRAIFKGLLFGTLLIVVLGHLHERHFGFVPDMSALSRKFLPVRTRAVLPSTAERREKLHIELGPQALRVTSIALGHPRLAVINGKEVAEGDTLTVEDHGVAVTLRVVNIGDGKIELANGTQIVTTLLPR